MTSAALDRIRSEALRLTELERAELAHDLVQSLEMLVDNDAGKAWEAEFLRRLTEIDAGAANLVDRDEFRRRMLARLADR